jgi:hypothetical protein
MARVCRFLRGAPSLTVKAFLPQFVDPASAAPLAFSEC